MNILTKKDINDFFHTVIIDSEFTELTLYVPRIDENTAIANIEFRHITKEFIIYFNDDSEYIITINNPLYELIFGYAVALKLDSDRSNKLNINMTNAKTRTLIAEYNISW